jgi:hypothetical protein
MADLHFESACASHSVSLFMLRLDDTHVNIVQKDLDHVMKMTVGIILRIEIAFVHQDIRSHKFDLQFMPQLFGFLCIALLQHFA